MKKVEKKLWTKYLNEYVGCPQDPVTQNRPCDFGCICDRCEHMAVSFEEWREMEVNKDGNSERD